MKQVLPLVLLSAFTSAVLAQSPWDNGRLRVSDNGRYLQHANGQPFFWLGDTCWLLTQKLSREEVKAYFENRKAKGFNVVQCVVVQMLTDTSVYGDSPIVDGDISRLALTPGNDPAVPAQYDYWDHVDYAIDTAAANGIYLAITPTWSHTVRRAPISKEKAALFAAALAQRFGHKPNIIWLNGGSARGERERRRLAGHWRDHQEARPGAPDVLPPLRTRSVLHLVPDGRLARLQHVHLWTPALRPGHRGQAIRRGQLALRARRPRPDAAQTHAGRRALLRRRAPGPPRRQAAVLDRQRCPTLRLLVGVRRSGRAHLRAELRPAGLPAP